VQPDQPGVPEIAEAVWLEVTRAEKLPQEIQGSPRNDTCDKGALNVVSAARTQ